jgi:hypothetical protein
MKKYIIIISMALLLAISGGCKKKQIPLDISGQWRLVDIKTKTANIGNTSVDVYLSFSENGNFEMYQMLGTGRYRFYKGTWALQDRLLSGKYSDGKSWGSIYDVEISGDKLILTSKTGNKEVDTYNRTAIPANVISDAE